MRRSGRHTFPLVMTYYPYTHDPDDTLDEAYMRWLHNVGFPAMRQLLSDQGCEDAGRCVAIRTQSLGATGGVHAVSIQEGEAQTRPHEPQPAPGWD